MKVEDLRPQKTGWELLVHLESNTCGYREPVAIASPES